MTKENMGESSVSSESISPNKEDNQQLILKNINELKSLYIIHDNHAISSNGKFLGSSIVFMEKVVRKIIRKFMGWYIDPILEGQTSFNEKVIESLNMLNQLAIKQEQKYRQLEDDIENKKEQ
jgi:hypothetical protein